MSTGENEQALRKILDMSRMISMVLLFLHLYYYQYAAFQAWGLISPFSDRLLENIYKTGLFRDFHLSKGIALVFLTISLLGARGRKDEKMNYKIALVYLLTGFLVYIGSSLVLWAPMPVTSLAVIYAVGLSFGFLLILTGGTLLSRIIHQRLNNDDIFNRENETFPQEERLLENEYSINLPAKYYHKGKWRKSWINIINPFRGLLVLGTPGSGKSYFVINNVIRQHIEKGFAMFVYDFKFDDLTLIAYNHFLKHKDRYPVPPKFYVINFDDLSRTHRCNPLDPAAMLDITDAAEAARTILLGLNREWIKRQGDFFVESPINFLTAIIWFLRKYNNGEFCTLPHVIELMNVEYDKLFAVLSTEKEIEALINPFVSAYKNEVMEQLEGQIASAKISMARLVSPSLYYVLSGNDFTLDINNPDEPKIVCMGNSPQKIQVYGAVLSLYVSRMIKIVNRKGQMKSSLIFDEFPTIYLNNIDNLMATARSNKVATTIGVQDFSQLKKDYGKDQADVIMNIVGNIIAGQVTGDTAKQLSDRFGKIMQQRNSISVNRQDISISRSHQLELALPPSKISCLSAGEFVGVLSDDPHQNSRLKSINSFIDNRISTESVLDKMSTNMFQRSFLDVSFNKIKKDIQQLIFDRFI
ncbi:conjugal transfer protein MobC [Flavihumibacter sp. UBA7668]|uniref:conjugal transfer protein MobC n=1 Tax=Flavihumibacter sp. UBA7668 TaxID=1946542 RepID=UPI0025BBCF7A|nr:conjugal transfer protein MobC [Flavihumibacter sp. UBA7668]